jgi:hypothetical protein
MRWKITKIRFLRKLRRVKAWFLLKFVYREEVNRIKKLETAFEKAFKSAAAKLELDKESCICTSKRNFPVVKEYETRDYETGMEVRAILGWNSTEDNRLPVFSGEPKQTVNPNLVGFPNLGAFNLLKKLDKVKKLIGRR